MTLRFLALIISIVGFCTAAWSEVRVVDGDTLEIDGQAYRLNGIDAPEVGQRCAGDWSCGKDAAAHLLDIIKDKSIACEALSTDQYGRIISRCMADDVDLGESLVSSGLAWAYLQYTDEYARQEADAKARSLGIWSDDNQPAWEFRSDRWAVSSSASPRPGCPIKGNISQNGRIYHTPWSPWYDRTRISEDKGERWFCDEAEALAAGWRAPYWP